MDIPTELEGRLFSTTLGKFFFVMNQVFFYAVRPVMVYPKQPTWKEYLNYAIVLGFDVWFFTTFGMVFFFLSFPFCPVLDLMS